MSFSTDYLLMVKKITADINVSTNYYYTTPLHDLHQIFPQSLLPCYKEKKVSHIRLVWIRLMMKNNQLNFYIKGKKKLFLLFHNLTLILWSKIKLIFMSYSNTLIMLYQ